MLKTTLAGLGLVAVLGLALYGGYALVRPEPTPQEAAAQQTREAIEDMGRAVEQIGEAVGAEVDRALQPGGEGQPDRP
ncbi:hypothetical protein [Roseospira navarrensis]|uniref:Uncharacterized protein n=1 Tax=Roseospira navarrensis TaxID=140058 RepID=A0A7X1ZC55_9PROT|nr:hypothetical protein [Roseospira navarrensis]MQX35849.1 hypothetical protein [Roseospira navarrensis]